MEITQHHSVHTVNVNTQGLSHNKDKALFWKGHSADSGDSGVPSGQTVFPPHIPPFTFSHAQSSGSDSAPLSLGPSHRKAADDLQSEALMSRLMF